MCVHVCSSLVQLFAASWTVSRQAPLSMGFSRQEYWSGLPCPSPVDLPKPGIEPGSPALQADALPRELLGHPGGPRHRGEHLSRVLCLLVQSPSHARLLVTPWTAARQVSLSLTISWTLPMLMSIASGMPSNHLILRFLLLLLSIFPSIRDFSNESSVHIR